MKKILFMIPNLSHGGAEKVLVNLVNNMDKSNFDITVMCLFDVGVNKQFLSDNVHYKYCFKHMVRGNSHILKLFSPKFLYKKLIKDKYDIIISYLEGPTARIVSGCDNNQTKIISWIHVQQNDLKTATKAFRNYNESLNCYKKFNQIVCVSESVKNDFMSLYPEIDNCIVLYNTNETKMIKRKGNEPIDDIDFDKKSINICGVGKLLPNKGFDRLLRIHKHLIDDGFKIHTYILGTGREKEKLLRYIKNNHLTDTCTLLGYKTNPYKYISKCDLFVCTSFAEGFSTAATEALILGVPVITTEVAGMKEMLGENEYGIITENDEKKLYYEIKVLLKEKEKLNYYKRQASIRGAFFSTENTVKEVEKLITMLINDK